MEQESMNEQFQPQQEMDNIMDLSFLEENQVDFNDENFAVQNPFEQEEKPDLDFFDHEDEDKTGIYIPQGDSIQSGP